MKNFQIVFTHILHNHHGGTLVSVQISSYLDTSVEITAYQDSFIEKIGYPVLDYVFSAQNILSDQQTPPSYIT